MVKKRMNNMRVLKRLKDTIYSIKYKIFKPRLKAKYQFGSPIVAMYRWNDYMVVATKLDIYITEDGVNYVRATREV